MAKKRLDATGEEVVKTKKLADEQILVWIRGHTGTVRCQQMDVREYMDLGPKLVRN
jgi:hypothetical protein